MSYKQPKTDPKKYTALINEIKDGEIKIPKFQRDFVWSIDKTARLLDSILKGYPIGTFILWETSERINNIKNIGNFNLPDTSADKKVQYVLDGQQRITSLFAAHLGGQIQKAGEKKSTDYKNIVVNLDNDHDQIVTAEPSGEKYIPLHEVLSLSGSGMRRLSKSRRFTDAELDQIAEYSEAFKTYEFSTVILKKNDIDSAIEVFTRINTGGQTLTLFEIMSAKTYDEKREFDMQARWEELVEELQGAKYEGISSTVVLSLLSIVISKTKECRRKTILALDKQDIIGKWDDAISALKDSINYFRTTYRIPVSQLLPYDSLLVPFAYFFYRAAGRKPQGEETKYLEEFFWRVSLSSRYSSATESKLAQDIKRIDTILKKKRPDYGDIKVDLDSPQSLIDTSFSAGNSYCKAILCLLARKRPKDFENGSDVILDNSWLKVANSKNYHHFFPKAYLKNKKIPNENSLVNITFVSDNLNKRTIRSKPPSSYIGTFKKNNLKIDKALKSHFINLKGFGIEEDDYETFLKKRARRMFRKLKSYIDEPVRRKRPVKPGPKKKTL